MPIRYAQRMNANGKFIKAVRHNTKGRLVG